MPPEFEIRDAREEDSAAIAGLLAELGHALDAATVRAQLRALVDLAPLYGTFVAVARGGVVGLASGFAYRTLHRPHAVGRIAVLVVTGSHAGRGIGSALLAHAERFLRALGCARIEITSAARRREAHEFYRRRGYVEQGLRFAREFAGQGPDQPIAPAERVN